MLLESNSFLYFIIFITLLLLVIFYYVKVVSRYRDFPTVSLLPVVLKLFITTGITKDIPVTSLLFRLCQNIIKKNELEGVTLVWLVKPYLIVFGEEAVQVLSNERSVLDKLPDYGVLHETFGIGLVTSNGELWRKRRKMFDPAFTVRMLKNNVSIVNNNAAALVRKLMDMPDESPEYVMKSLKFCAFANICESMLGLNMHDPKRYQESQRFLDFITMATDMIVYRWFHPWLRHRYMLYLFSSGREYLRKLKESKEFMAQILQEIKDSVMFRDGENLNEEEEFLQARQKTFAQILVHYHLADPSFTMKDMLDELYTFVSAGYDTVSYALMWCLFLLGRHPEIQNQVFEEVQEIAKNENISDEDVQNLRYLECIIKESLRLYSPVPIYGRYVQKDVKCGKYVVPKGTHILFCPAMAHRDPNVYPDPDVFDPERFRQQDARASRSLIPFSEGIRNCIGKKFAMLEIKIVLAYVLKNFKITSLDRPEDINLTWNVTLSTTEPLRMRFTPRQ